MEADAPMPVDSISSRKDDAARIACITVLILLLMPVAAASALNAPPTPQVERVPAPEWVKAHPLVVPDQIPMEEIQDGIYYLRLDWQIMAAVDRPVQYHTHFSEHIANETGLETASRITITFDPSYQVLNLHYLDLHRNGTIISKLAETDVRLLQREEGLESSLYDGRYTASLIISDLRVGDTLDIAYTITGDNPVFDDHFFYRLPVSWRFPVEQLDFMLHWPKERPLTQMSHKTPFVLARKDSNDHVIYSLSSKRLTPHRANSQTPSWYWAFGEIQLSEMSRWTDVVDWALPLYRDACPSHPIIADLADTIRQKATSDQARLAAALHFIQQEIRYLGIETGANSHRPSLAHETLDRKFGDCKDKSVAMIGLLAALDIEAQPVLVNTDIIKDPTAMLPTPQAFNHVIVRARMGSEWYYLDPTRTYQSEELGQVFQPDYGYALVIAPGQTELIKMPDSGHLVGIQLKEEFDLRETGKTGTPYTVTSAYRGLDTERVRRQIAEQGLQEIGNQYLDYYRKFYPGITSDSPMAVECYDSCHAFKTIEHYRIQDFWNEDSAAARKIAKFHANALYPYLKKPDQRRRTDPFAISYPVEIKQELLISLPETIDADEFHFTEENEFFISYATAELDRTRSTLRLAYHYRSLTDAVPAGQTESYIAAIDRVNKNLDYRLHDTGSNAASEIENWFQANLGRMLFGLLGLSLVYVLLEWMIDMRRARSDPALAYFPVSYAKFIILSVVTVGVYQYYWFYKQWDYVRRRDASSIMPFFRTFFMPLWFFALYRELRQDSLERFERSHLPGAPLIGLLLIVYIGLNILGYADTVVGFAEFISFFCLLPFVNYINYVNRHHQQAVADNSKFRPRHFILVTVMSFFLGYTFLATIHWIPSSGVITGNDLPSWTIRFMQRQGLVQSADDLIYFYCDAYWSNKDDGNGVTKKAVFSYWRDEATGRLIVRKADYTNIDNIRINSAESTYNNTTITIIPESGDEFMLYISTEDGMDKQVVNEIQRRITAHSIDS